jgi:hypothetical protein
MRHSDCCIHIQVYTRQEKLSICALRIPIKTKTGCSKIARRSFIRSCPECLSFLISSHPPRLLIEPPPTNSGRLPMDIPFLTYSPYSLRAWPILFPKIPRTCRISYRSLFSFPIKALCPQQGYCSSSSKSDTILALNGFKCIYLTNSRK